MDVPDLREREAPETRRFRGAASLDLPAEKKGFHARHRDGQFGVERREAREVLADDHSQDAERRDDRCRDADAQRAVAVEVDPKGRKPTETTRLEEGPKERKKRARATLVSSAARDAADVVLKYMAEFKALSLWDAKMAAASLRRRSATTAPKGTSQQLALMAKTPRMSSDTRRTRRSVRFDACCRSRLKP